MKKNNTNHLKLRIIKLKKNIFVGVPCKGYSHGLLCYF